jgi:hypothetical protein
MAAFLIILSTLLLGVNTLYSPVAGGEDTSLAGVWKGNSVCQVKESPCNDEVSVYYVSKGVEPDNFQMRMNKVVDGKEQTMGTVNCKAGPTTG